MNEHFSKKTVIVDTQCANLSSVLFALQRLNETPVISSSPECIQNAHRVILPGVGTAQAAMNKLHDLHLVECIRTLSQPVLGICLGMQLLASFSEEGQCKTLGITNDTVFHLKQKDHVRLPHMGWNTLKTCKSHALIANIDANDYFYFVHSYAFPNNEHTLATCEYGQTFSAIIQKDNFFGVQFHPERSGKSGAQLLKNFLSL